MSDSFTGQQINASIIRLTAAQWTAQPYVLPAGVIGLESDTGAFKIGDGETAWADLLAYSTPTGVKTYRALLTQTGTGAPVATVLENTLGGTVVWGYSNAGDYTATLAGAFTASTTFISITNGKLTAGGGGLAIVAAAPIDANTVGLVTGDPAGALTDELLLDASLEILVYP